MRNYEAMYIVRPGFEDEKYAAVVEKFNAIIEANGGEVVKTDLWGKRRLAYEIEKVMFSLLLKLRLICLLSWKEISELQMTSCVTW